MGLGNLDLGRDRLRKFNELGQHTRVEMPSWVRVSRRPTTKTLGGRLKSGKTLKPRVGEQETNSGRAIERNNGFIGENVDEV